MAITLAVDAMGGDHGPRVTVPASLSVLKTHPALNLVLVGQENLIRPLLARLTSEESSRVSILHTDEVVLMDDKVAVALRNKRNSSMRLAINLVHEGKAAACVSAGNTGALMAVSRFVLKTHAGIDRPAIMTALPTVKGHCHMLDLGANVDSEAVHLLQFAQMGSLVASALDGIDRPRVGLLNIGEEEIKGNDLIKEANGLLKDSGLNYIGYVEGDGVFAGEADVVVCDGFVGNIALKTTEGVARMFGAFVKEEINRNLFTKLAGAIAIPIWNGLRQRMDPGRYNGASLVGLTGIVIKSHGSADQKSFANAIRVALKEVEKDIPSLIAGRLQPAAGV
ncbi:phosphate:acyl-[acyl carrier protein] acyltransferase [Fluviicoccus keumensis]|uniref:Phosphate acyltransferase n=1 Tax=Fluviicoccus keumensis TaxID=1435465 RepID=A0A4V2G3J2_9GAMM|nr:phosphate acyltransferase PlsX [Fluviicoccus keumensis]RZU37126.1 phosphate:acyl-[acyl carrier protein] acyltransferase [Fluviicoccus keumensis]